MQTEINKLFIKRYKFEYWRSLVLSADKHAELLTLYRKKKRKMRKNNLSTRFDKLFQATDSSALYLQPF